MRITELENMVKATEQKRTEYEDVTIKLRGLWDQLCEDLSLLAKQALSELVRFWVVTPQDAAMCALSTCSTT